jgi:hypothetical protein
VLLVAVIDTAFWPLLKRIFYFFEDLWSGRSHQWMSEAAWMCIKRTLLALALLCLGWIAASAARHPQELGNVLHEFFSTYPAARLTETFKLMSLWGLLVEFGLNLPPQPSEGAGDKEAGGAGGSVGGRRLPRLISGGGAGAWPQPASGSPPRRSSSAGNLDLARMGMDDKRVPLLAAQH